MVLLASKAIHILEYTEGPPAVLVGALNSEHQLRRKRQEQVHLHALEWISHVDKRILASF